MDNKRIVVWGFLGGTCLGLAMLWTPSLSNTLYEVKEGFLGHDAEPMTKPVVSSTDDFNAQVNAAIDRYKADSRAAGGSPVPLAAPVVPPIESYAPPSRLPAGDRGLAALLAQQSASAGAVRLTPSYSGAGDTESASRRYLTSPQDLGRNKPLFPEPIILNPSGPTTYTDSQGDSYVRSGPHGAVNARTGEFIPTN